MAEIDIRLKVDVSATLVLNERECAALEALVGYGDEAFLEVFYTYLGSGYLKPHEAGLRSLFAKVRETAPPAVQAVKDARHVIFTARAAELKAKR